eukprot:3183144-Amphidinium_carterae.1
MSGPSRTPAKRGRSAIDKAHEADSSTSKAIRVRYDKGIESQVATALRGPKCKHLLPIQIDGVRDSNGLLGKDQDSKIQRNIFGRRVFALLFCGLALKEWTLYSTQWLSP